MDRQAIAVVDDDPAIVGLVMDALKPLGYEVCAAGTVAAGIELARRARPDLLILDRKLPDGDGIEICHALRHEPRFGKLPILFLTATSSVAERVASYREGADDYLAKPFDVPELLVRVRTLLSDTASDQNP